MALCGEKRIQNLGLSLNGRVPIVEDQAIVVRERFVTA
jgi:hypothetical protein